MTHRRKRQTQKRKLLEPDILELHAQDMPYRAIAAEVGASAFLVWRVINEAMGAAAADAADLRFAIWEKQVEQVEEVMGIVMGDIAGDGEEERPRHHPRDLAALVVALRGLQAEERMLFGIVSNAGAAPLMVDDSAEKTEQDIAAEIDELKALDDGELMRRLKALTAGK